MSWDTGNQKSLKREPINEQIMDLEGYLEDTKAKIWLYKFLKENVTFATELLTGIELFPFQHMAVKAMMQIFFYWHFCFIRRYDESRSSHWNYFKII